MGARAAAGVGVAVGGRGRRARQARNAARRARKMRKAGRRVEWVAGRRSQRCRGRCHCHYRGRGRGHEAAAVVMVMVMEMESTARRGAAQGGYEATRWDGRRQIRAPRRLESSSIGRTAATEGSVREGVWACGRRRGLLRRREGEVRGDDGQHPRCIRRAGRRLARPRQQPRSVHE